MFLFEDVGMEENLVRFSPIPTFLLDFLSDDVFLRRLVSPPRCYQISIRPIYGGANV